ncbi:MAG: phosphotransferase [Sphingomonadaceae bacterium]
MDAFPASPDAVSEAWLGDRLGCTIETMHWEPIGTGQVGDSVRFHLQVDKTGKVGPKSVAAKFAAADATSRGTATMFGLYTKEVGFYRDIIVTLDVRAPKVHFADVSGDGSECLLVFEDLGPARGGDQVAGCSLEDARAAIVQAARIHGPSWQRPEVLDRPWIATKEGLPDQLIPLYAQAQAIFYDRYATSLEPELMAVCARFAEVAPLWFHRPTEKLCIVHGDFRLDNMLFDIKGGTEPIAILDWQTVAVGNPLVDIGYFLGCGIGDKLRSRHEFELLTLYRGEMANYGVQFTDDVFRRDYRIGALHGLSTAVFSAAFVERTERGDANFLSMARGAASLALEHDSIGALKGDS